ncbi:MAG: DUF3794 domain-containing protein [Lachnospiraceae bacterium]|nr:DUF3794 domain-containing protein [Lachnospiraceae bacterium]
MPSELGLVKKEIVFRDKIGKKNGQILLEGDIVVPDIKPDVENILRVSGKVSINNVRAEEGRVNFSGTFNASVIYESGNGKSILNSMNYSSPIDEYIAVEECTRDAKVRLKSNIEHMEYRLINDRKVSIKTVLSVICDVEDEKRCDIVMDASDDGMLKTNTGTIKLQNKEITKTDIIPIKEEFVLPAGKPEIGKIIDSEAMITQKDVKISDGKVQIKGEIKVITIYTPEGEEGIVEVVEHTVPFNGYVEVEGAKANMPGGISIYIDSVETQSMADSDGEERLIDLAIDLGVILRLFNIEEISIVEDAYSLRHALDIERETIRYQVVVCQSVAENSAKGVITIPDRYPDVFRVVKVWGDIKDYEASVGEGKVNVEGTLGINTLYIGNDDERPVSCVYSEIPFSQEIEAIGAKEGMDVDLNVGIKDILSNMTSERDVEVRAEMDYGSIITEAVEKGVITDILPSLEASLPETSSVVIYYVEKGDTLWNIAKKYNTTIEDIAGLNGIKNWDAIYPGQQLIIIKSSVE